MVRLGANEQGGVLLGNPANVGVPDVTFVARVTVKLVGLVVDGTAVNNVVCASPLKLNNT